MALDARAIASLAMLVTGHHLSSLRVAAESNELRRNVNYMEGKPLEAVSFWKQLH